MCLYLISIFDQVTLPKIYTNIAPSPSHHFPLYSPDSLFLIKFCQNDSIFGSCCCFNPFSSSFSGHLCFITNLVITFWQKWCKPLWIFKIHCTTEHGSVRGSTIQQNPLDRSVRLREWKRKSQSVLRLTAVRSHSRPLSFRAGGGNAVTRAQ